MKEAMVENNESGELDLFCQQLSENEVFVLNFAKNPFFLKVEECDRYNYYAVIQTELNNFFAENKESLFKTLRTYFLDWQTFLSKFKISLSFHDFKLHLISLERQKEFRIFLPNGITFSFSPIDKNKLS